MNQNVPELSARRLVAIGLLSWLAMLGADFFLHGGLLAKLYAQPSPFLLAPEESFRRIPLGYLAALLFCALLLGLMVKLGLSGWRKGLSFGILLGALAGGTAMLGLYSISTAELGLLVGWFLSQTVEMGLAGAVAGSGLAGQRLRALSVRVVALVLLLIVLTIALQSVGLAPAAQWGT
ncbi:MAG: hypothetical protein P8189_19140 [Anaerolineae bacterium]